MLEVTKLNRDSEIVICSIFVGCELRSCDTNSTLGSIVPLAMFISEAVKETRMQFIQIHFSPATFDELELDVRVTIGRIIAYAKASIELILNCSFCYYGHQRNCGWIRWVFSAEWWGMAF